MFETIESSAVFMEDKRSDSIEYVDDEVVVTFELEKNEWIEIVDENNVVATLGLKLDEKFTYSQSELSYIANNFDANLNENHIFYEYILFNGENGESLTALIKRKEEGLTINTGMTYERSIGDNAKKIIRRRMLFASTIYLGFILLWIILFAKRTVKVIIHPLMALRENFEKVREGNYNDDLVYTSKNELAMIRDDYNYTLRKLREMEIRNTEQDASKRQLILDISHDLKTPLTSVLGYSRALMDGKGDNPNKFYKRIYTKTKEITSLINVLTEYTELHSSEMVLNRTEIDINAFLRATLSELYDIIEEKGGILEMNLYEPSEKIEVDQVLLKRAINNLVINALHHNESPVKVSCTTKFDNREIQVEIKDNGQGIRENDYLRIFDSAVKLETSRPRTEGSGFGLSIVKKIIEKHNGYIEVKSELGHYSAFNITLPKEY